MRFSGLIIILLFTNHLQLYPQWKHVPSGGPVRTYEIYSLGGKGTHLFAGSKEYGVLLSNDNGATWLQTNLASGSPFRAILVTDSAVWGAPQSNGVILSTNFGENWISVNNGLPDAVSIDVLFISNGHLLAGSGTSGLFVSANNGINWTPVISGFPANTGVFSITKCGNNLFAGTNRGVFISTDNGLNWAAVNTGLPANSSIYALVCNESIILAGTANSGVFKSTDNGVSWVAANTGLTNLKILTLSIVQLNCFVGTTTGLFVSSDYGSNWQKVPNIIPSNTSVKTFTSNDIDLFASTSEYVWHSSNTGSSWEIVNIGLELGDVRILGNKGTSVFTNAYNRGVWKTSDDGMSWKWLRNGLDYMVQDVVGMESGIFAAVYTQGICRSTDDGNSWTEVNSGINSRWINCLSADSSGVYAGYVFAGVFSTATNGNYWDCLYYGEPLYTAVLSMVHSGSNLLVGTQSGLYCLTKDNYWRIRKVSDGFPTDIISIRSLKKSGNRVFASTDKGMFSSIDNGLSWAQINDGLPNPIIVFSFVPKGDCLFLATDKGMYVSINNGASWKAASEGLPQNQFRTLTVGESYILLGTYDLGVWRRPIVELTGVDNEIPNTAPVQFGLIQNYPNPFNPSTTISYNLPHSGLVSIKVYDVIGVEIAELVHEDKPAGSYQIVFNGRNLSSGVYYCTLTALGLQSTQKMLLVK